MRSAAIVCVLLSLAVTGCTRLDRIANPPDWPVTWRGRTLYTTSLGWYYARDVGAAAYAEGIVRDARERFERQAERAPRRGLIVVTSPSDEMLVFPEDDTIRLVIESPEAAGGGEAISSDQREAAIAAAERMMALLGSSFQTDAEAPVELPPEALRDAAWVAFIPSPALVRRVTREMFEEEMKRDGVSLPMRVLISPALAWAEGVLAGAMADAHRFRIFEAFVLAEPGLTADERAALVAAAAERMIDDSRFEPPPELSGSGAGAQEVEEGSSGGRGTDRGGGAAP